MPRATDPASDRQVRERAKRMRENGWRHQVLQSLAGAILQAARWRAWEASGREPGPDDSLSTWPRLPDSPGERVQLGVVRLDMSTSEGWEAAQELLSGAEWKASSWPEAVEDLAEQLAEQLEHSHLLGASFYTRHSRRASAILSTSQRTLPVTILGGGYQSLWRTPEHPPGLPPADHPLLAGIDEEALALSQVAWEAARDLYRSLGGSTPDSQGRRGLEQPENLRDWCLRLGLVEPDGSMAVGPVSDEEARRAAMGLPWTRAQSTMLSPRVEEQSGDTPAGHLHQSRKPMGPTTGGYAALVSVADHGSALGSDPRVWAHVQKAQTLLESHGPEMARLSLYLSMHVCGRPDPTAPFLVEGEDLLRDFGLEGTSGGRGRVAVLERSRQLKHQAEMARALDLVTLQCTDYMGPAGKDGRRPFRRWTGRLWNVESLELGTETQLTLDGQAGVPSGEVITTLRLLVRPGGWVVKYPATGDGQLWYGHVATAVLQLSHERNQLAAVLGLYLSTALYERQARHSGEVRFRVGELLGHVLPDSELRQAREDRRYGERLRSRWVAALELLHHRVGFRFSFCPDTYPAWAVPEVLQAETSEADSGRAPHGALDRLMKGHLTIRWPEPVLSLAGSSKAEEGSRKLAAAVKAPARRAPARGTPNGQVLKEARRDAGLNQRAAAALLGVSQGQLCKLEGGLKVLSRNDLNRYLEQLADAGRAARWARGRK